nr:hypothetical protein [uncultured Arsenicibacter sp.]
MALKRDDSLWKGILESVCDDFLRFMFAEAENLFDFQREFEFLDKELEELFPSDEGQAPKFVDKLVKVYTQQGKEEWILIHIEVQGYRDTDFARRMFTYFYRILDKHGKPVTSIAVFTDSNPNYHPTEYSYEFLGTRNLFSFNTYKIIEQDEALLLGNENPFAIVVLTTLLAIQKKKLDDENLYALKFSLARRLLSRQLPRKKVSDLLTFLQYYVRFADPAYSVKFEESIASLSDKSATMGIQEMIIDRARKEGLQKGIEQGLETAKTSIVKNLILAMTVSDSQIAAIAEVPVAFVKEIRQKLGK